MSELMLPETGVVGVHLWHEKNAEVQSEGFRRKCRGYNLQCRGTAVAEIFWCIFTAVPKHTDCIVTAALRCSFEMSRGFHEGESRNDRSIGPQISASEPLQWTKSSSNSCPSVSSRDGHSWMDSRRLSIGAPLRPGL